MNVVKKRIVIFGIKYFPSRGGTSRIVESLLKVLKDHYDITIYCYKDPRAETNIPGIKTIQFPETKIKGFGVFFYYLRCCIHLMRNGSYDLVHVHKTDAAFFVPFLERRFKTIVTSHALPYYDEKWSVIGRTYFHFVERVFVRSKGTITSISKAQAAYYEKTYGRKITYIPNGIPTSQSNADLPFEAVAKEFNITSGYLLFAARRIIPLKGCHTLIKALNLMEYKGTLLISGDQEQMPEYTKELIKASKNLKVKFLGYVADLNKLNALIKGADFFVFPSEIEGMSMMLLEVALNGTPLICSNIPQNTDVLTDKEVLYFESKDALDLSEKIQYAHGHREEMEARAKKAAEKIKKEYDINIVARRYMNEYEKLIADNP